MASSPFNVRTVSENQRFNKENQRFNNENQRFNNENQRFNHENQRFSPVVRCHFMVKVSLFGVMEDFFQPDTDKLGVRGSSGAETLKKVLYAPAGQDIKGLTPWLLKAAEMSAGVFDPDLKSKL